MTKKTLVPMMLSKDFRFKLRKEAAKLDMSMIEYSKFLASSDDSLENVFKKKKRGSYENTKSSW